MSRSKAYELTQTVPALSKKRAPTDSAKITRYDWQFVSTTLLLARGSLLCLLARAAKAGNASPYSSNSQLGRGFPTCYQTWSGNPRNLAGNHSDSLGISAMILHNVKRYFHWCHVFFFVLVVTPDRTVQQPTQRRYDLFPSFIFSRIKILTR